MRGERGEWGKGRQLSSPEGEIVKKITFMHECTYIADAHFRNHKKEGDEPTERSCVDMCENGCFT